MCDRNDAPESVKHGKRRRRSACCNAFTVHTHGPYTSLPKQWQKFVNQADNKASLADVLKVQWMSPKVISGNNRLCTLQDAQRQMVESACL